MSRDTMSQETIRAAERAAGQVNTMSTYDPDSDQLHEECGIFGVWAPIATWLD